MTLCLCELENLLSDAYPVKEIAEGACTLRGKEGHRIKLMECGDNIKVVKLPKGQPNVFKRHIRICDYLIFVPDEARGSIQVILCELTTSPVVLNSNSTQGVAEYKAGQIKSTIPLVHYILMGLRVHFDKKFKFNLSYVILCKELIAQKQLTLFDIGRVKKKFKCHGLPITVIRAPSHLSINHLRK